MNDPNSLDFPVLRGQCDARILIVDDQEGNLRLIESILRQAGYTAYRSLQDSRQTLAVFLDYRPDLILLDMMMPHLDGVAVLKLLSPLIEGTYLPVLMLTADVSAETKRRGLAAGANDFLTKPVDVIEVGLRIHNLLETRRLHQSLQRRATERIQEQAALLDWTNDAILATDMQDRITFWNAGAERLYGWTAGEVMGQPLARIAGMVGVGEQENAQLTAQGKWSGELRQTSKAGRELIVASRCTLIPAEPPGQSRGRMIVNTDITEKKRLETHLIQAQKLDAVGQLAGGIAHDFNNLLTVINGWSGLLLQRLPAEDPTRALVEEICKAGERSASLTRQLLAFSRKQVVTSEPLDLNIVIDNTEKMLRRIIGEDIELIARLDRRLGIVTADPCQIEQVIMNLAVNCRDAMPRGGRLLIETSNVRRSGEPTEHVLLAVSDTGCGMTEEVKQHIFEPFFTTKEVGKGTGLGLAVVHGIVKQSGGHIEVETERGAGTTVKIYLPRLERVGRSRRSAQGVVASPQGTETILLVEDEEAVRRLTLRILLDCGYTVLEATDGQEAVRLAESHSGPLHLVATDVVMPGLSGSELMEQLLALHPETKILFLSGYLDDALVRHGIAEEKVQFLPKPYGPALLAAKVREVLDARYEEQ